jgi:transposase
MALASAVTLGIDTHKDVHVAVTLDELGRRLGVATFSTDDAHHQQLWQWASSYGPVTRAGVEGTGSFGYRLAQFLVNTAGVSVIEVNRPNRVARRRRGKSDPVDAEAAARSVMARDSTAIAKTRAGIAGQLRVLMIARRSALKARIQAQHQLRSLILELDDTTRARVDHRRADHLAAACSEMPGDDGIAAGLRALGHRWCQLTAEVREHDHAITRILKKSANGLLARPGVGPITAAQLIVTAGDNPDRLHSSAAFAALCGVTPVEHSSGKTQRHRLNRGGDRAANSALWTITTNRMRHDPRTRAYVQRRSDLGNSRKEIIRMLKRYIVRELFREITAGIAGHPAPDPATA